MCYLDKKDFIMTRDEMESVVKLINDKISYHIKHDEYKYEVKSTPTIRLDISGGYTLGPISKIIKNPLNGYIDRVGLDLSISESNLKEIIQSIVDNYYKSDFARFHKVMDLGFDAPGFTGPLVRQMNDDDPNNLEILFRVYGFEVK
jgi:hypothetical protein